jgi:hypothetical protein
MTDWKEKRWGVLADSIVPAITLLNGVVLAARVADSPTEAIAQLAVGGLAAFASSFMLLATAHRYIREAVKEAKGE